MILEPKIRVLLADESPFFRRAMAQALAGYPVFEIAGEISSVRETPEVCDALRPDIVVLDVDTLPPSVWKLLVSRLTVPALVVSQTYATAHEATRAGAAGFVLKPTDQEAHILNLFLSNLARHLKIAARVGLYRAPPPVPAPTHPLVHQYAFDGIIALGASTGGTQSTAKILRELPGDFPGMVIVQHMPRDFTRMYADNLDRECAMSVREARDGDMVERGVVLIAPGNQHMEVSPRPGRRFAVRCYQGERVGGHCPSVDVLFSSVAKYAKKDAVGVILTGMGADGAKGLLEMRRAGAFTVGQDEKSCVVYGMPKEAHELGAVVKQAPLSGIAAILTQYVTDMRA